MIALTINHYSFYETSEMADTVGLDLDEIYTFALKLAHDAGQMLGAAWRTRCMPHQSSTHAEEKDSAVDLVTQADEGTSQKK